MRMIIEIRLLGFRLVLDPKTVEALLAFIASLSWLPKAMNSSASSTDKS